MQEQVRGLMKEGEPELSLARYRRLCWIKPFRGESQREMPLSAISGGYDRLAVQQTQG